MFVGLDIIFLLGIEGGVVSVGVLFDLGVVGDLGVEDDLDVMLVDFFVGDVLGGGMIDDLVVGFVIEDIVGFVVLLMELGIYGN